MPTINKGLLNATAYATLFQILATDGGTLKDMCEETGFTYPTVGKILSILHKRQVIRIASWEPDVLGRVNVRVWVLADGKADAKKPPRKTSKQRCRDYYFKQQQVALITGKRVRESRLTHVVNTPLGMKAVA